MSRQRRSLLVGLLLFALVLAACGGGQATETTAPPAPDSGEEGGAAETEAPQSGEQAGGETSGGSAAVVASSIDLDAPELYFPPVESNYYTSMEFNFRSTAEDGSEIFGRISMEGAFSLGPPQASRIFFTPEGYADIGGIGTLEIVGIDDTDYMYSPVMGCLLIGASTFENPYDEMVDTGGILGGEAQLVEEGVTVNGVLTDRYEITMDNLDPTDPTSHEVTSIEEGSAYVAREGGYLVRVVIAGRGYSELLSGNPSLEGDTYYELNFEPTSDPITITPPEGCAEVGETEFPVMDDAFGISSLGGIYSYQTNYSFDEVVAFYKTEMATLGWSLFGEVLTAPTALLNFSMGDRLVQVIVTPGDAEGTLFVTITEMSG